MLHETLWIIMFLRIGYSKDLCKPHLEPPHPLFKFMASLHILVNQAALRRSSCQRQTPYILQMM